MKDIFCCYCETPLSKENRTKDHVPPKSFFTISERLEAKLITVPSCFNCNNSANLADEVSKIISVICALRLQKCSAELIQLTKRTIQKNMKLKSWLGSAKTIYAEKKVTLTNAHKDYFFSVMKRIARGMFYHLTSKSIMAQNVFIHPLIGFDFDTLEKVIESKKTTIDFLKSINYGKKINKIIVKKGIFEFWYSMANDHPDAGVGLIFIRNSLLIACIFQ